MIFSLFRILGGLVTKYLNTSVVLAYSVVILNIGTVLIILKSISYWIPVVLVGIGGAPILPGALGWAAENLNVTELTSAIFLVISLIAHVIFSYSVAVAMDFYGPIAFMIFSIIVSGLIGLICVILIISLLNQKGFISRK